MSRSESAIERMDWRNLVALDKSKEDLGAYLESPKCHPVILLEGLTGIGKRHLARWLAAKYLCSNSQESPCGTCGDCREVIAGVHPDLYWLDRGKDSIKVADIKNLQEHFGMLSSQGYRVGVICNGDQMTLESCNRALKTIEEPDPQVRIIITTSKPLTVPATVLGRCLRWRVLSDRHFNFVSWMETLYKKEGRELLPSVAHGELARRLSYSPGRIYKAVQEGVRDELSTCIQDILNAQKPQDVLKSAAQISKNCKPSMSEFLEAAEWELSKSYRDHFERQDRDIKNIEQQLKTIHARRETIRELRKQGVFGRVTLNTQLAAEAVGLSRWVEEPL